MLLEQLVDLSQKPENQLKTIYEELGPISVNYNELSLPEIQQLMGQVLKLLSIVGKLQPGPTKASHTSRIMGYMNKVRGAITRMLKQGDVAESQAIEMQQSLIDSVMESVSMGEFDKIQYHLQTLGVTVPRQYMMELIDQLIEDGVKLKSSDEFGRPVIDLSALKLDDVNHALKQCGLDGVVQYNKQGHQ